MSTLTIAGNLTRDPELRSVNGGRSVVSFSIAENRRWADKATGATQEAVTYLDVTAWGAGRTRRHQPAHRRPPCHRPPGAALLGGH